MFRNAVLPELQFIVEVVVKVCPDASSWKNNLQEYKIIFCLHCSRLKGLQNKTIGAWKCNFQNPLRTEGPNDKRTNGRTPGLIGETLPRKESYKGWDRIQIDTSLKYI